LRHVNTLRVADWSVLVSAVDTHNCCGGMLSTCTTVDAHGFF